MTRYLNPVGPKELWLLTHGTAQLETDVTIEMATGAQALFCLVDNGPFTAAALIETADDLEKFTDPTDPRIRVWFTVPHASIAPEELT